MPNAHIKQAHIQIIVFRSENNVDELETQVVVPVG